MRKRLTTDDPEGMLMTALNMYRVQDHSVVVSCGGKQGEDMDLRDYMREIIREWKLDSLEGYRIDDDERLDQAMCDNLEEGTDTAEGLLARLYQAAWAFAEIRERLKEYEDREENGTAHAHWEDVVEQTPKFDEVGHFLGIVEKRKKRCSNCLKTNRNYEPPYCPHCGARMDEVTADGDV